MTHKDKYEGIREGMKWAVNWLHERAKEMNDPHATQILNSAAFSMGSDAGKYKRAQIGVSVLPRRKPRRAVGLWPLLTPEQQAAALEYRGPENIGFPERNQPPSK